MATNLPDTRPWANYPNLRPNDNRLVQVTFDTDSIRDWAYEIPRELQAQVVRRALERLSRRTVERIERAAPIDTGRLRSSFRYNIRTEGIDTVALLYVLDRAYYWRFLEYGTRHVPSDPFIRPQLRNVEAEVYAAVRDAFQAFRPTQFEIDLGVLGATSRAELA